MSKQSKKSPLKFQGAGYLLTLKKRMYASNIFLALISFHL